MKSLKLALAMTLAVVLPVAAAPAEPRPLPADALERAIVCAGDMGEVALNLNEANKKQPSEDTANVAGLMSAASMQWILHARTLGAGKGLTEGQVDQKIDDYLTARASAGTPMERNQRRIDNLNLCLAALKDLK